MQIAKRKGLGRKKQPERGQHAGEGARATQTMRVIAGQYRSRPLRSLRGVDVRPTADRLRETLFNVLCAGNPEALAGTTWLDLYAGTGAVGIEALSRGAGMVYFVESSKAAAELMGANLKSLGIDGGVKIMKAEVGKALAQLEGQGVVADFVFLDPPYRMKDEYARALMVLAGSTLLRESSVVIAEHEKRFDPGEEFGRLRRYRKLTQGDAGLSLYRRDASGSELRAASFGQTTH
ncbi:MAG: 16S rRNA (guanine(966)-N(2))-methyltransferase RsmD [Terriglobales bacterium]